MSTDILEALGIFPTETLEKLILFPSPSSSKPTSIAHHSGSESRGSASQPTLPVDITESPTDYSFLIDVPGLSKSHLQVTVEEERVLVIRSTGKRKREEEEEEEEGKYLRMERRRLHQQKLARKFQLPEDADVSAVSAKCENGVLTVSVKKLPPVPKKPKTVQIVVS